MHSFRILKDFSFRSAYVPIFSFVTNCLLCLITLCILVIHLQVANSSVRANAASLLIEAFPLQDPEANREDTDALMQKQIDILEVSSDNMVSKCCMVPVIPMLRTCNTH